MSQRILTHLTCPQCRHTGVAAWLTALTPAGEAAQRLSALDSFSEGFNAVDRGRGPHFECRACKLRALAVPEPHAAAEQTHS